jgi:predicted deacylase
MSASPAVHRPGTHIDSLQAATPGGERVAATVVRISSGRSGPILAVFAAMHGTEYASVAALGRLIDRLHPEAIDGTLVLVPVANQQAFETRTMYVSPSDGKNLNRTFPGKADGTYTEVLADLLWRQVASSASYVVDVHGGEVVEGLFPFAGAYAQTGRPEVGERSRRAAEAFHPPYLVLNQVPAEIERRGQRLSLMATDSGIPAVLVEAGSRGILEEADIRFIHDGILNLMRLLGMLPEPVEPASEPPIIVREVPVLASGAGLFHARVKPGDRVVPGQPLGDLVDYVGHAVERFTSEWDGVVLGVIGPAMVSGRMPLVIGVTAEGWAPHQPL